MTQSLSWLLGKAVRCHIWGFINGKTHSLRQFVSRGYLLALCMYYMYGVGGAVVHIRRIYNSIILTANTIHSGIFFWKTKIMDEKPRLNYIFIKLFLLLFVVLTFHRKIWMNINSRYKCSAMAQNFDKKSHVKFDWEMFFKLCDLLGISEL